MKKIPKLYKIGLRYPKSVLAVAFVGTLLSLFVAKNLKIEASLTAMAPKHLESVQSQEEYKRYFGGDDYLVLTVEEKDSAITERFADEFSQRIEGLRGVAYVDYRRPVDYFKKRIWLYLDLEDLQEMDRRMERALELEKKGVSLYFGHLMDFAEEEDRPDLTFQDIFKKYENKSWRFSKYAASEEGDFIILRVKLGPERDGVDSAHLIDEVKKIEVTLKEKREFQGVTVGYTGTAETTIEETDQIKREMAWVSLIVALVLVLILLFYFKKFQAIFLVGVPLSAGVIWTGGLVYLVLGHLNLMTSFAGGILAGLGSDYGIYLLTRYYLERGAGKNFQTACCLAFENTGTATYASMITTLGAFVALLFSRFGVFFEFGFLGALGVVLNYVAMMVVLPSLLVFFDRFKRRKFPSLAGGHVFSAGSRLFTQKPVLGIVIAGFLIGAAALSLPTVSQINFNEEMMVNKKLAANRLYEKMDRVKSAPLSPTILITKGFDEAERTMNVLDQLVRKDTDHVLVYEQVVGLPSFFPKQVLEKKAVLMKMAQKIPRFRWFPKNEKGEFIASLNDSIHVPPVTRQELPKEVRRAFESPFQKEVLAVYLFPAFDRLSSETLKRYHDGILALKKMTGLPFTAVDGTFIYDDIVRLIERETPRGMTLICLFLALVLYLLTRSVQRTLITFANLLGSLILLSGVLWLVKIPLNVMNIAAIPVILGTGIDSFIHFAQRYDESRDMKVAIKEKIPAILFSNLTTIVGFAGLILVSNPGLRSVGWVAVLGLVLVTALCTFIYPRSLLLEAEGQAHPFRR